MPFSKHINISLRRFSISTAQVCNILCAQVLTSEVPGILLPPFSCHWQRWGRELWIHRFLSKKPEALCSSFVGQHAFKNLLLSSSPCKNLVRVKVFNWTNRISRCTPDTPFNSSERFNYLSLLKTSN